MCSTHLINPSNIHSYIPRSSKVYPLDIYFNQKPCTHLRLYINQHTAHIHSSKMDVYKAKDTVNISISTWAAYIRKIVHLDSFLYSANGYFHLSTLSSPSYMLKSIPLCSDQCPGHCLKHTIQKHTHHRVLYTHDNPKSSIYTLFEYAIMSLDQWNTHKKMYIISTQHTYTLSKLSKYIHIYIFSWYSLNVYEDYHESSGRIIHKASKRVLHSFFFFFFAHGTLYTHIYVYA